MDSLSPHLFMNLRVVDEHARQLGAGRSLAALKSELGSQARGAFQALAGLKVPAAALAAAGPALPGPLAAGTRRAEPAAVQTSAAPVRYTAWTFDALPELLEIRKAGQTLVGFPALIDAGDAVTIEVFDEPQLAAQRHRDGLRRLFSLQIRDALKYLEKNIPELQKMATAYMPLGTLEELRVQIVELAMDRAFLQEPVPTDAAQFRQRLEQGRSRLTLIANEVARQGALVLTDHASAARKLRDSRHAAGALEDVAVQLSRLVPKRFLSQTPWPQLQHLPRYLQAIVLRLEKYRADPARDAQRLAELKPLEARYWRLVAERKGVLDQRLGEFRWLLEELRVSFFAQELRTPQPVSVKRLEKAWGQLGA